MFTKLEQHSCIKIEMTRGRSTQECFQGLRVACDDTALPYRKLARKVKAFRKGRDVVQENLCTGRSSVENSTVQLLASLLDADRRWTARKLVAEDGVCHKTLLHILHDIPNYRKLATCWIPHEISEVKQWHRYAVAQTLLDRYQKEGDDFLLRIVCMD